MTLLRVISSVPIFAQVDHHRATRGYRVGRARRTCSGSSSVAATIAVVLADTAPDRVAIGALASRAVACFPTAVRPPTTIDQRAVAIRGGLRSAVDPRNKIDVRVVDDRMRTALTLAHFGIHDIA